MKKKITLISLVLLVAVCTFGQNPEKTHRYFKEPDSEKHVKNSESGERRNIPEWVIQKNRRSSNNNLTKSAQTTKQQLATIITQDWVLSTGKWVDRFKEDHTYNANGNMTKFFFYIWDESTSKWKAYSKDEYSFDSKNNLTQFIKYNWDLITNQLVAYDKDEYTYDASGNLVLSLNSDWDYSTNKWVADFKIENTYDDNGNITEEIESDWDKSTGRWIALIKSLYNWDDNGILTQEINNEWDLSTSKWVADHKTEYTWDENGNLKQNSVYSWYLSNSQWVNYYKQEHSYDANGKLTQRLTNYWDGSNSQWVGGDKVENTNDANGNMIKHLVSDWDNNKWVIYYNEEYKFDLSFNFSDLIVPNWWTVYGFVNKPLEYNSYVWDDTSNGWVNENKAIFYYSDQNVTNTDDIETKNISLYPNPVLDFLIISFSSTNTATIELFDLQGRSLLSKEISNNEQLNLKHLNNGMYFYNLYIDGNKHSGKLIKE